jgi:cyclohexyl-isocyanide hydratase
VARARSAAADITARREATARAIAAELGIRTP